MTTILFCTLFHSNTISCFGIAIVDRSARWSKLLVVGATSIRQAHVAESVVLKMLSLLPLYFS